MRRNELADAGKVSTHAASISIAAADWIALLQPSDLSVAARLPNYHNRLKRNIAAYMSAKRYRPAANSARQIAPSPLTNCPVRMRSIA